MRKLKFEDVQRRISAKGFVLISTEYTDSKAKLQVVCSKGHTSWKRFNDIDQGMGCLECSGLKPLTLEEAREWAAKRGGECLATEYINAQTKMPWKCKEGHLFEMHLDHVKQGHWCWRCNPGRERVPWTRYEELCGKKGGKLLADTSTIPDSRIPVLVECKEGHRFARTLPYFHSGHWCPECARVQQHDNKQAETECYEYCRSLLDSTVAVERNKTELLPSSKLELDIWIPSSRKAIELDGENWHDNPECAERDARKSAECAEVGIELLRLGYRKHWYRGKKKKFGMPMVRAFLLGR
jgi:hypothetical protein